MTAIAENIVELLSSPSLNHPAAGISHLPWGAFGRCVATILRVNHVGKQIVQLPCCTVRCDGGLGHAGAERACRRQKRSGETGGDRYSVRYRQHHGIEAAGGNEGRSAG